MINTATAAIVIKEHLFGYACFVVRSHCQLSLIKNKVQNITGCIYNNYRILISAYDNSVSRHSKKMWTSDAFFLLDFKCDCLLSIQFSETPRRFVVSVNLTVNEKGSAYCLSRHGSERHAEASRDRRAISFESIDAFFERRPEAARGSLRRGGKDPRQNDRRLRSHARRPRQSSNDSCVHTRNDRPV